MTNSLLIGLLLLPQKSDDQSGRRIIFQVWDWTPDGRAYILNHYIIHEDKGIWHTNCLKTTYRALQRKELTNIMGKTGFTEIVWLESEESGYYQSIVIAYK